MQPDLNRVIEQVSKEKGIDRGIIVKALEEAMLSAAKKTFGHEKNIEAKFNTELGEVELFEIKMVVEHVEDPENQVTLEVARAKIDPEAEIGDELLAKLPPEKFGRIAAQAAKQNIIQRVRDAERDIIYNEFTGRKGELFSGIVQRFEKKNIIVNLGRTDAILPEKEQIPRERYRQGDRIRAYILDVELTGKGPQIVLSRTHPGLLIKLFEQEVPEIYEGIVEVKGAAREPGGRAKIAVTSNDRDVDPVGACAGQGVEDHHGRGRARHGGDRPRRPALARHRQEGAERAPRLAAHDLEARRAQRGRGRGRGASGAGLAHRDPERRRRDRRAPLSERLQVGRGAGRLGRGDGGRDRGHRPRAGGGYRRRRARARAAPAGAGGSGRSRGRRRGRRRRGRRGRGGGRERRGERGRAGGAGRRGGSDVSVHEPVRTCVGCGARAPQRALRRFVAGPAGLRLDGRRRGPGRGAY